MAVADCFLEVEVEAEGAGIEFGCEEGVEGGEVDDDAVARGWVAVPVGHFLNPAVDSASCKLAVGEDCFWGFVF